MTAPARVVSRGLAVLVTELELRQPTLITLSELAELARAANLKTPPAVLADRLRRTGWLLSTGQRGVYEFAPAAHAGPYGHGDPFIDLRAALAIGHIPATLALQSALWLHGMADRTPNKHEVALPSGASVPDAIRRNMRVVRFSSRLTPAAIEGLAVQQAATILIHLVTKPADVRGWASFADALPELAARSAAEDLEKELEARPSTVRTRLAYLLSGVAPQVADHLQPSPATTVVWFGTQRTSRRYDKRFNVADSMLTFDPRSLNADPA